MILDILDDGPPPKRGDIAQTNVGDRRERTWMILRVRKIKTHRRILDKLPEFPKGTPLSTIQRVIRDRVQARRELPPRFDIWMARWWELEADFRMRLYRSAERAGGQNAFPIVRYPAKKKRRDPFAL